ncbi:MAG: hypothetical protein COB50_00600 [Thiotrichales bacterium]|nr:MAG: hypothetical protein COB50_00600 [Thiotrichales bacterium]
MRKHCTVLDTLTMARKLHPGQKNSLDALCKRYAVDNSKRDLHGALLDAKILAKVYCEMTSNQLELFTSDKDNANKTINIESQDTSLATNVKNIEVLAASIDDSEKSSHAKYLQMLEKYHNAKTLWQTIEKGE